MQLDENYCCASCGKVSSILGSWKRQVGISRDARQVDVLHYRLFLSYRLLNCTSRFRELHEIVAEAKTKLEAEVGPIDAESIKFVRGIVSRLAVASNVQKLSSHAIDKAEEWLANIPSIFPTCKAVESLPTACRFLFEEVASSSLKIVVIDIATPLIDSVKGCKLWYCKSADETFLEHPLFIFLRDKLRISVKSLQPCTEYAFKIVSYTETGNLGPPEAKCFTKNLVSREERSRRPVMQELDLNVILVPDLNDDATPPLESS